MNLTYKNEKILFAILAIFSLFMWAFLIVGTMGAALIYLLMGFIVYLFVQSGFISHIRGNGVNINATQFPELYAQFIECCKKLDMDTPPELYILNSDGILNALATKFSRRKYVVLYSGVVDALKKYPDGVNFYMGHELGHIKRGHLTWMSFIWPGSLLPLVGAAYRRAQEYSCDLHGLHCCKQTKDAAFALAVLATGQEHWSKLNIKDFMQQSQITGGFWMAFHEYTGDYPWLCKRMQHIVAASKNEAPNFPRRSFLAGFLALFVPRLGVAGGTGGLASLMVVVAIIGILAAVALPAYQDYTVHAKTPQIITLAEQIKAKATPYITENNELPNNLQVLGLPVNLSNRIVSKVEVTDDGFLLYLTGTPALEGKTVLYKPYITDSGNLAWRCDLGSLEKKYLPRECRTP